MLVWVLVVSTLWLLVAVLAFFLPVPAMKSPRCSAPWRRRKILTAITFFYTGFSASLILLDRADILDVSSATLYDIAAMVGVFVAAIVTYSTKTAWAMVTTAAISPFFSAVLPMSYWGRVSVSVLVCIVFIVGIAITFYKIISVAFFTRVSLPLSICITGVFASVFICRYPIGGWIGIPSRDLMIYFAAVLALTLIQSMWNVCYYRKAAQYELTHADPEVEMVTESAQPSVFDAL